MKKNLLVLWAFPLLFAAAPVPAFAALQRPDFAAERGQIAEKREHAKPASLKSRLKMWQRARKYYFKETDPKAAGLVILSIFVFFFTLGFFVLTMAVLFNASELIGFFGTGAFVFFLFACLIGLLLSYAILRWLGKRLKKYREKKQAAHPVKR